MYAWFVYHQVFPTFWLLIPSVSFLQINIFIDQEHIASIWSVGAKETYPTVWFNITSWQLWTVFPLWPLSMNMQPSIQLLLWNKATTTSISVAGIIVQKSFSFSTLITLAHEYLKLRKRTISEKQYLHRFYELGTSVRAQLTFSPGWRHPLSLSGILIWEVAWGMHLWQKLTFSLQTASASSWSP